MQQTAACQDMADPSPLSLSNLIATTCHHNALSMDPRAANLLLGPGVSELLSLYKANQVAKDLHTTLTRFGWSLQEGFTSMLDLPGFRSALQKLKWTQVSLRREGAVLKTRAVIHSFYTVCLAACTTVTSRCMSISRQDFKRGLWQGMLPCGFASCHGLSISVLTLQVDTLGMGTFGIVHKARDRETGDYVAIKQLLTTAGTDAGLPIAGLREVNALQALQHENIVR